MYSQCIHIVFNYLSKKEEEEEEEEEEVRAPTVDVGYVPNAKYLAHTPHQTQFKPIYQML